MRSPSSTARSPRCFSGNSGKGRHIPSPSGLSCCPGSGSVSPFQDCPGAHRPLLRASLGASSWQGPEPQHFLGSLGCGQNGAACGSWGMPWAQGRASWPVWPAVGPRPVVGRGAPSGRWPVTGLVVLWPVGVDQTGELLVRPDEYARALGSVRPRPCLLSKRSPRRVGQLGPRCGSRRKV